MLLEMGTEVGELARKRFPHGICIQEGPRQLDQAIRTTRDVVRDSSVAAIFEGAFQWQDLVVRVDILERVSPTTWRLVEVKATSKVKKVHFADVGIQAMVLQGDGIRLEGCGLMHLNTRYRYDGGQLDLTKLFQIEDLSPVLADWQNAILDQVQGMRLALASKEPPRIAPGDHCHTPYECPFWEHCTKSKPARWIYHLPDRKERLPHWTTRGIHTIDEIPEEVPLTVLQRRVKENVEWVSPDLLNVLRSVTYPVHHLDFETFMPAIPLYPNTRPYRPIPMQWSNHIEDEDGTVRHEGFLSLNAQDPREEVANSVLASLGESGSICVYSDYERQILLSLADQFPALQSRIAAAIDRLWDLLSILRTHYYHPGFGGSFSIKAVLPVLVPALGYEDLGIRNGAVASMSYRKMIFEASDLIERAQLATDLERYCARDTEGMLEIRRALLRKARGRAAHHLATE